MDNLQEWAKIWGARVRLNRISARLVEGDVRSSALDPDDVRWCASLLGKMDWGSPLYLTSDFPVDLADSVRPHFFKAVIDTNTKDYRPLLKWFYGYAAEPTDVVGEESEMLGRLLRKTSENIFVSLNRNGH